MDDLKYLHVWVQIWLMFVHVYHIDNKSSLI